MVFLVVLLAALLGAVSVVFLVAVLVALLGALLVRGLFERHDQVYRLMRTLFYFVFLATYLRTYRPL